jgi:hypothetical protein
MLPVRNAAQRLTEGMNLTLTNGAQGRNRTTDTRIFSPLLYRLSYLGVLRALRTIRSGRSPASEAQAYSSNGGGVSSRAPPPHFPASFSLSSPAGESFRSSSSSAGMR